MILHIVLFKPRLDLAPVDRQGLVAAFERAMRDIPAVRGVRVARRIRHGAGYESTSPDVADYAAIIEFDDVNGLRTYLAHPAHQELGTRFGATCEMPLAYDFEEQPIDRL